MSDKLLGDEDSVVRSEAVSALRDFAHEIEDKEALEPAIEPLIEALEDKDDGVRFNAAYALRDFAQEIEDKKVFEQAIEPLLEVLKDEDEYGINRGGEQQRLLGV